VPAAVPESQDASSLADWAELRLLLGGGGALSWARIRNVLDDDGTDAAEAEFAEDDGALANEAGDPEAEEVPGTELDVELDARIEQLLAEINLRQRAGGSVYPFELQGTRLVRRDAPGAEVYLLLLVLSLPDAPFRKQRRAHQVERAYDELAREALRRFLGRDAGAVRFARSSHDPDDPENTRPIPFDEAIAWLRAKLDLGRGTTAPEEDDEEPHWEDPEGLIPLRSFNDAGVDVVAWWRFMDGRVGFPVLLAQCTVQLRWEKKLKDVDPDLWREWINFGTVPPQKCLVIPFAVDSEEERWPHRTTQAGVIIDRVRMIELLDELADEDLAGLVAEETRAWMQAEIEALA
jgi:hypothetical protein